ncbi:MAG TPA: hypothetical protein PKY81_08780 [bacterium]|nr:hypothetical protein [bacterium]HPN31039.1 hypothetical protein [bacterium]
MRNPQILIIRYGALGDTLTLVPLLYLIKKNYPHYHTTLSVNGSYSKLIQFFCSAIEEFNLESLNKESLLKYDLVFAVVSSSNSILCSHLKTFNSGAIIFADVELCEKLAVSIYNFLIEKFCESYALYNAGFPADFFQKIGAENKLQKKIFHPGSGGIKKNLSVEELKSAISKFELFPENTDILLGPAEINNIELRKIFSDYNLIQNIFDYAELVKILKSYDYYFGFDSGVSHLAALCGLNCKIFFKANNYTVWKPFGKNVFVQI